MSSDGVVVAGLEAYVRRQSAPPESVPPQPEPVKEYSELERILVRELAAAREEAVRLSDQLDEAVRLAEARLVELRKMREVAGTLLSMEVR